MNLFLLRHAKTTANEAHLYDSQSDSHLSLSGEKQAIELVPKLSAHSFDVIFVTPLSRTRETIAPYLKTLQSSPPIIEEPLMIERDLGEITGRNQDEGVIAADMARQGATDKFSWVPPGGESIEMVMTRVKIFYEKLRKEYPGANVLIVSHRNPLRCLELLILGRQVSDFDVSDPPKQEPAELREYNC